SALLRPPPSPPLLPYTTLFRSRVPGDHVARGVAHGAADALDPGVDRPALGRLRSHDGELGALGRGRLETPARALPLLEERLEIRSEEHTSELQSRENLVCRLLL